MKKINVLLIAVIVLANMVAIQSCQSSKSATGSKMLKFNFEKGKGYDYEMITNVDQEIMGKSMQMDMSAYYSMDVTADSGDTKTITTSVDRFKMKMGMGGMNLEVDTDKPVVDDNDTASGKNPFKMVSRVFGAIKGQHFSMKVDGEGKVLEVTGFENMAKSIVDSMGLDEDKRQEMMQQFNKQFSAKSMKEQLEKMWYIFPNKEVKVGDTWQKDMESSGTMAGKYNSTYKVKEIEGDMVTLDQITKVISDNEQAKLSGEITGTLVVDSRNGLIVNADQDMKMTASAGGMSFDIKGKTKIKGKARQ
jgi:RNA recognition motif-containing protein